MAKFQVALPNTFENRLKKLDQRLDNILDDAIKDGAKKTCEEVVRPSLAKAIGSNLKQDKNGNTRKDKRTGELLSALGASPVKVSNEGFRNSKIGFKEPRKNKTGKGGKSYYEQTNAMIATVLEYGKKDKSQPARPWLRPVRKKAEEIFTRECVRTFDEEVAKI